jgi:hypothetical protein
MSTNNPQNGPMKRWGDRPTHSTLILVAYAFTPAWMIWLVVVAWRMQPSDVHRRAG